MSYSVYCLHISSRGLGGNQFNKPLDNRRDLGAGGCFFRSEHPAGTTRNDAGGLAIELKAQ